MDSPFIEPINAWRAAQKELDKAIENYLQKTMALESIQSDAISAYSTAMPEGNKVWHELFSHAQAIPSRTQSLETGRIILSRIYNRSPSLVPISKLPAEILLSIFSYCALDTEAPWQGRFVCDVRRYNPTGLIHLSGVCTRWRLLVVNEPSFWSHITFCPDRRYNTKETSWNLLRMSLERLSGSPLCITVPNDIFSSGIDKTLMAFKCLRPLAGNTKSLIFPSCTQYRKIVPSLLYFLQANSLESITLAGEDMVELNPGVVGLRDESYPVLSDPKHKSCLLSVSSLHLRRASFSWDSPIYHNLLSLTLDNVSMHARREPTTENILAILSSSPQLNSLALRTKIFASKDTDALPSRVELHCLKRLDLHGAGTEGLLQLLPRLFVSSTSLMLEADIYVNRFYEASMNEFLARINVTGIVLNDRMILIEDENERGITAIQRMYSLLPNLERMWVMSSWGSNISNFAEALSRPVVGGHELLCPKLRKFSVEDQLIRKDILDDVIRTHPLLQ
ncbi:FAD-binding domain protein [Rhizoctonia solani]|uniref:FAD-binding domain protein n=1 Tax=Rhizoctonia solani TaxID=456999 RepID=A0A8H8NZS1_9AGAM|nr:FAD-binding domain protein [Rhizoctonia solani]QRW22445.1 FAD-binding domain protein [Rhizoctonia solani]